MTRWERLMAAGYLIQLEKERDEEVDPDLPYTCLLVDETCTEQFHGSGPNMVGAFANAVENGGEKVRKIADGDA